MSKIYTKIGDDGLTSDGRGNRVPKNAPLMEALGAIDELNAVIGIIMAQLHDEEVKEIVRLMQRMLVHLSGELSVGKIVLSDNDVRMIEDLIDAVVDERDLKTTDFSLPGRSELHAWWHYARTLCRRAERRLVALSQAEPVHPELIAYVNRLSDLLFVLAETV